MLKRSMVLVMVLVLVVSFSVVALADEKAPKNNSGVQVHVEIEGKEGDHILIGDALGNNTAKENNPNPILVAGS